MDLRVCEIFYSIQGEGPSVGKPAVFLRLSGCNLRCTWCDSKFTWEQLPFSKIADVVKEIKKYPVKHLIITGGEPTMQQEGIVELLKKLKGYTVELETNGSIPLKIGKMFNQINCSPKLESSGNKPYKLQILPSEKYQSKRSNVKGQMSKVIYKFVIGKKSDLNEMKEYCEKYKIPKDRTYLMPLGVTKETIGKTSAWLIETCKKEGYNFSPRLHIMIWGNKRAT